jgi:hypothetical protein
MRSEKPKNIEEAVSIVVDAMSSDCQRAVKVCH